MILKTNLLPHQIPAVEKLQQIKVGALYMEMGTGKTRTALELIYRRLVVGKVNKVLWLCPCSVKTTIRKELQKHIDGDFSYFRIEGIESLSSSIKLNCELLEYVKNNKVFLIVDESNLVKNHRAKRTINIERLAEHCQYKLILNGTPVSRCEKDLFSQWYILDWRILGYKSFWSFAANHLEYDERVPGKINRCLNTDYLVRKISPYTYQRKKSECLQLPEKTYSKKYFILTDEQYWHYKKVKEEFLLQLDEFEPHTIYRLFTALQHVLTGNRVVSKYDEPIRTVPFFEKPKDNPRIQILLSLLERIDDKVVIWCKYTHEIENISNILGNDAVCFYGEITKKQRDINTDLFANKKKYLIANKSCASYGLNLQFCNYAIYYNNDWDWATRSQSEDRLHRIGQNNNVHIIDIVADGTLDERILKCLERKEGLSDAFKYYITKTQNKKDIGRWIDGVEDIQQQKCV